MKRRKRGRGERRWEGCSQSKIVNDEKKSERKRKVSERENEIEREEEIYILGVS